MKEFKVWCADRCKCPEDADSVMAIDAAHAAETWAERSDADSGEYRIVGGHSVSVMVWSVDGDAPVEFIVKGEAVPSYRAYEQERK